MKSSKSHRTQVFLPQELYLQAKDLAKKKSVSLGKLIRDSLQRTVKQASLSQDSYNIHNLKGALKGKAPNDLARNLNKYLKEMYQ